MPKGFRLLIIVLFCACSGNAQQLSIRGVLQDANDKIAVIGATILLFQDKDSVSRTNAISDKTGTFIINTPGPGTYTLRISSVGYGNVEKTAVIRDSSTDLGIIAFAKEAKLLDEVIAQAAMPFVRQKGDTLEYRANAFKVNPDANAEDLVRKMPGITVDQGTVKAGERISKRSLLTEEIFLATINRYYQNGERADSLQQFSDQLTDGYQLSANFAYTEPVGAKGQLQDNYNPSYSKNKSDQQTFQYDAADGKYSSFDSSLSNRYNNVYSTQNGGVTYRIGNRDNMFSAGLAYQYVFRQGFFNNTLCLRSVTV